MIKYLLTFTSLIFILRSMKKLLLSCMLALSMGASAQIIVNESFEGSSLPSGWTGSALPSTAGQTTTVSMWSGGTACVGSKMAYRNLYSGVTSYNITYSSASSNGTELTYSFQYAAKGYSSSDAIKGSVVAEYTVDGGTTWVALGAPINLNNPSSTPVPCTTVSGVIPAGTIPAGADFKFRLTGNYTATSDFYLGFDDVKLTQVVTAPPGCSTISAPVAGATGVSRTPAITWSQAAGATGYLLNVGTTPGGTDVINGQNVGNVTSYSIPTASALNYSTVYYVKVIPTNNLGNTTNCTESSFTTLNIGCPSVSAPSNNALNTSVTPAITWSSVSGATGYRLSVGTTSGGTEVLNNIDLGNVLTYTFPSPLNYNTAYYYTVNAYQGTTSTSASCTVRKFTTKAPPPANDECANAVVLGVNSDINCAVKGTGNTLGATQSASSGTCSFVTSDDDVWFSFVATASSHVIKLSNVVSTGTSSTTDMYFQVLSGTCGSFTSLLCSDADANSVSGLTPGETYYVKVFTYSSGAEYAASFEICIGTLPPPPANDECSAATALTVSSGALCTSAVVGTTLSATSSGVAVSPCTGTADDDVWYSFVATSTSHVVALTDVVSVGVTSSTSLYLQVLSGACGSMTSLACDTSPATPTVLTGLTVGSTYYIRVYNSNTGTGYANTFKICVSTPVVPANDECGNAVTLPVSADLNCAAPTSGTTHSATNSNLAVSPCTGTADDDVWYAFTATGPVHTVMLSNVVSTGSTSSTSLYTQVFSGACGSLTSLVCGTSNSTVVPGLTTGQTYYVRVYNSNGSGYSNSFNICVGTPPPPPANDECSGAVALTVGNNFNSNPITATSVSATTNGVSTCVTTGSNNVNNVWFSVVVPPSGSVTVETASLTGSSFADSIMEMYSGSCGTLTSVGCNDDVSGASNRFSKVSVTGQTPGSTLYVSVWKFGPTNPDGEFRVSAYDSSVLATSETAVVKNNLKVYPNPFSDILNISDVKNVKSVSVIDLSGRVVKTIDNPSSALQLGDLKQGMYLISLKMKDGSVQTLKTIKK